MSDVSYIPAGMVTVTPYLTVEDCAQAMDWYREVFGAVELMRMPGPGGKIMHAEMTLGTAHLMLADAFPEWGGHGPKGIGGTPVTLHLYVEDTDSLYDKAIAAGATSLQEPNDAFWGDRFSKVVDPFGHHWSIATHMRDVTPEEMDKAMAEWSAANAEA